MWHARAHIARLRGDADATIHFAQAALADLPTTSVTLRAGSMFTLGAGYLLAGDLPAADALLQQARALCLTSNELALLGVIVAQGDLHQARGELHAAVARHEEALARVGERRISGRFEAQIRLAGIWREWNELLRALQTVRDSLASRPRMTPICPMDMSS